MNRRGFLKLLAAQAALATVPVPAIAARAAPPSGVPTLDMLRRAVATLREQNVDQPYYMTVGPSMFQSIITETARWRWKAEYRRERLRRKGKNVPAYLPGELGAWQGVRIIQSQPVSFA